MMLVPRFIHLVEENAGFFSLAGLLERPPLRVMAVREGERIPLWRINRVYVDFLGEEHGVYELVGFADTVAEAYPWLAGC